MNLVGIDVSADYFDADMQCAGGLKRRRFNNTAAGHRQAIGWISQGGQGARVCLEATGIYHLQLALALHRAASIELMVVNPKAIRRFAEAQMRRGKTDPLDARVQREYLSAMAFSAWQPPTARVLQLQSIGRRMAQLIKECNRERSRLHAAQRAGAHSREAQSDIQHHLRYLERRIERLIQRGVALLAQDSQLREDFEIIDSAPGFAERASLKTLAELAPLPQGLQPRQWTAMAGLDPKPHESGSSVRLPRRISKQGNAELRAALYMPALVAIRRDPNVRAFYDKLIAEGKAPMQAVIAVMRKLLHALHGMLHHRQRWDGNKFYRMPQTA